ncbi:MAG TPA: TA system VapC family ribonuclease toxin [Acidobacteriaceae bacterium]
MIVIDANILLYAYDVDSPRYQAARTFLEGALSGVEPVGIPLTCVSAFLRISTQRGALHTPYSIEEAAGFVDEWLALPHVRLMIGGERHWPIFRRMLLDGHAPGRLVTDAEIAALTIEYGGELQTNDRGFARFPGLRWRNPLAKA